MKNKIAAVVLAASMFGTAVMPAANVFAAEAAETEEATTEATEETADEAADETAEEADAETETEEDADAADASEEEAEKPAKDIVMKDDAAEADFDGVWKLSGLRVFDEALNADDYGMDSSFLTIKDGKLDIYAASEYGQSTDIPGFEMAFEDGKYVIAMDEDFANKLKDPEEEALGDSFLNTDELESKVKELTAGNNSKLELQLTEDGQLAVTCAVDVQNDYLTFSTKAIQILADKSSEEDLDAAKKAAEEADVSDDVEVVYCVPAIDIVPVVEAVKGTNVAVGAENMYYEEKGAYTGEIAPEMLVDAGVKYVIIGHSERRDYFKECDCMLNKKVKKAFEHNLTPILCCGETLEQREMGITLDWIRMQIKSDLKDVTAEQVASMVIAYEPIWAIGTGKTATTEQAEEVCKAIRDCIKEVYGADTAEKVRIQYGGSVNAGNAAELFAQPDIDGGLVGGASLKADFGKIVNYK